MPGAEFFMEIMRWTLEVLNFLLQLGYILDVSVNV
jgi:hypothetical protein